MVMKIDNGGLSKFLWDENRTLAQRPDIALEVVVPVNRINRPLDNGS